MFRTIISLLLCCFSTTALWADAAAPYVDDNTSSPLSWNVSVWQAYQSSQSGHYIADGVQGPINRVVDRTHFGAAIQLPFSLLFSSGLELGVEALPDVAIAPKGQPTLLREHDRWLKELNLFYSVTNHLALQVGVLMQQASIECSPNSDCVAVDQRLIDKLLGVVPADFGWDAGIEWTMPMLTQHSHFGVRLEYLAFGKHEHCVQTGSSGLLNCDVAIYPDDHTVQLKAIARFGF